MENFYEDLDFGGWRKFALGLRR